MRDSKFNNLDIKIQVLENKVNQILKNTRYSSDSNDFYSVRKYRLTESIKYLLQLTKEIKNELQYALESVSKNTKTVHLYRKVCVLESELHNLLNNYNEEPIDEVSCSEESSCKPCKARVQSDYSHLRRNSRSYGFLPTESQSYKEKVISHRREPGYEVGWESSSDSPSDTSCYLSSSGSSSSFEVLNYRKREPFSSRKSKSSFRDQYPVSREVRHRTRAPVYIRKSKSSIQYRYPEQKEKRHPSRLPVYVRKSKSSLQDQPPVRKEVKQSKRDLNYVKKSRPPHNSRRVKKKKRNPFWKKSSSQFEIHKSDSNIANVDTDDSQTEEVFLIKKKRKSKSMAQTEKQPSKGRVFVSRLKRVLSSKSRARVSKRNGSTKVRKSSTESDEDEKYSIKKSSKKRSGIANYKDNKSNRGKINHKHSNESFYVVDNIDRKKSGSKIHGRVRSQQSKPITVARTVNLGNNPFSNNTSQILHLQNGSFIIVPHNILGKQLDDKQRNEQAIPKSSNQSLPHLNYSKHSNASNQYRKGSSSYNNESNKKILGSFVNLNSSVIENNTHVKEPSGFKSASNSTPQPKTYQTQNKTVFVGEENNLYSSSNGVKTLLYNDSSMNRQPKNNEKSNSKLILLKIVGNKNYEDNKKCYENQSNFNIATTKVSENKRLSERRDITYETTLVMNNAKGTSLLTNGETVPKVSKNNTVEVNNANNKIFINGTSWGNVNSSVYVLESNHTKNQELFKSALDLSKGKYSSHSPHPPEKNKSVSNISLNMAYETGSKVFPIKTLSKDSKTINAETSKTLPFLKSTKSFPKLLSADKDQNLLRNQSHTDSVSRASSNLSLNRTNSKAKGKNWLTRSVSKLNVLSKRAKKPKGEKAKKSLSKDIYTNDLSDKVRTNSEEKPPSSGNASKTKSWTSLKRVMSGAGSFVKTGKNKKKDKQVSPKTSENEQSQKKKPLLKRMFSKTRSKSQKSRDTAAKPASKSDYEGDLTPISSQLSAPQNQYTKNLQNIGHLDDKNVSGYRVGSKPVKQSSNTKSFRSKPLLTTNEANHKQPTLKDNPKPYSYSLHYSKKKHKCVEMSSVPSLPCLVGYKCSPYSKLLWSQSQTDLKERELSEFEKCNDYHEFLFKPVACECCVWQDKKVSKSCQERGAKNILSDLCPSTISDDNLCCNFINCKSTNERDHFLSDSSDVCDWKKIANEIK